MVRFFLVCGAAILSTCNVAEAADEAINLTAAYRAAGYAVVMCNEDGEETEIVGDFDLVKSERRWA